MAPSSAFDPVEFKRNIRTEWRSAAGGWRRWLDVVEGPEGGQRHSAKLIELAELRAGDRVLDVGGGYGEPSLSAARVVGPDGRVVCTDISEEMLATARDRATEAGIHNVEFVARDAEDLDYDDETFDAVISRATLMFLPDVPGTLRRLHGFLRPGGTLAASVWGPIPAVQFAAAFPIVSQELELPPPPPGRPGAFALSDLAKLAALVTDAGFRDVETGTLPVIFETDSPEEFTDFIRDVAPQLTTMLAGHPTSVQERVWGKITDAYRPFQDASGRVRTENQANLVKGGKGADGPR
ncbi:MAG TPA: class I SAM-dependent methyltransferase [Actinomycetota bacterium]